MHNKFKNEYVTEADTGAARARRYTYSIFRILSCFLISLLFIGNVMAKEFSVGQVWKYKTRSTEVESKVTVLKVDFLNEQEIIHIYVDGLKIKNPQSPTGYGEDISHMPISVDALKESVTEMVNETESLPDYEEGYGIWKEAFDSGKAGIFTIPVSGCVEFMEQTLNQ